MDGGLIFFLLIVFGLVFGLIGGSIASAKGGSEVGGFLLGAFLGPIGLVIAALLGSDEGKQQQRLVQGDSKTCPQCAEIVKREAKICRFCRHEFPVAGPPAPVPARQPPPPIEYVDDSNLNLELMMWGTGVLAFIGLVIFMIVMFESGGSAAADRPGNTAVYQNGNSADEEPPPAPRPARRRSARPESRAKPAEPAPAGDAIGNLARDLGPIPEPEAALDPIANQAR